MNEMALQTMATDIAPELDRLLHEWLSSDMILGTKPHHDLERFLWDNKIGLLRLARHVAQMRD